MERNAVLFLVLSILIIIGYSVLAPPAPQRPTPSQSSAESQDTAPAGSRTVPPSATALPPITPGAERTVTVETDLYRVELSTRGGVIRSWRLKRYTNGPQNATPIDLYTAPKDGQGVAPLAVVADTPDGALQAAILEGSYALDGGDLLLSAGRPTGTLRFETRLAGGQVVSKRLTFHHDSYQVDVELVIEGLPVPSRVMLGENFGIRQWGDVTFVGYVGPTSLIDGEIVRDKPSNLDQPVQHSGTVAWTALQDKYFLAALIPSVRETTVVARKLADQRVTVGLQEPPTAEPVVARTYTLYAGPKEYDRLVAFNIGLDRTIDFGWFIYGSWGFVSFIAKPLFLVLKFLYEFTGNYGVAIMLLTAMIKVLFVPLTHKSYMSMKAMQTLQPQMQAIQKKYKHDKMRLNQELMNLYKANKANPLGGCLPMLLQIPVFIALFNILYTTIELRQAPFFLWIHDLSEKDPSYLLPILMGGTMVLQQKLQPTTMDPRQAKLMLLLPVVFTFFFLSFPSGLVLYWMVNNLLSILQTYVTMRYWHAPEVVVPKTVPKAVSKKG